MKWISVEDRMPSKTGNVLGYIDASSGESIGLINCYICPEYENVFWETLDSEDVVGAVTHWMPLPEPPTTGESDV